jgi:hypothetical protein
MIVLDTNVLSEAIKTSPDSTVREWLAGQQPTALFTTTISQAEMFYGLMLLPHGHRRKALADAIGAVFEHEFANRILPFDSPAAQAFARIMSERRRAGRAMAQVDAQIAAIAASRNASIATRKVHDFAHCGVPIIDPWQS